MPKIEAHEEGASGKRDAPNAPREPFTDQTRSFDLREGADQAEEVQNAERRRKVDTDPALSPASILGAAALSRGGRRNT